MARLILSLVSYTVGAIFILLSVVVAVDLATLAKDDRALLHDLGLRVSAVEQFLTRNGRLPQQQELPEVWRGLPPSGRGRDFQLSTTSVPLPRRGEVSWPSSGGWAIWVWLGESSEYYTSWNQHYSPSRPLSWYAVEGPLLFSPVFAAIFVWLPFATKRKKPNKAPEPTPTAVTPRATENENRREEVDL